ncbi:hypothetical protein [Algoriphagus confluentis]|uniref:Uncharacterized protein n=1 Tax=Algoriphagus confluentis TaxID=1697556 RepID=A0ABQ6PJZ1_9BACT|nr:hypothetical protein Aconfl_09160 [Algoriphagus confluentis]
MIYKTYFEDRSKLDSLKETGMGYQIVSAKERYSAERRFYIIYNSELIISLDSDFDIFKYRAFKIKGLQITLNQAEPFRIDTSSISVFSKKESQDLLNLYSRESRSTYLSKSINKGRQTGGRGAIDSPMEEASGNELFTRLSAFENDRRIDFENRCLKNGSFTTTYSDYKVCVNFNDDPVDRYALPNEEEIKHAFMILPKKSDKLQRGIVQPAFGKNGGGIEAYFDQGTSQNTYLARKEYGYLY